jgi:hypothetical protein
MEKYELSDPEVRILKQLHDRVNRPARNMAGRLRISTDVAEKTLLDGRGALPL